jgi:hypothetical protein
MVHLPGPIYPRTKYVEETLELLLKKHPDASIAEIERLIPDCRNVSRKVLEEMVAGIKQRRGQARVQHMQANG